MEMYQEERSRLRALPLEGFRPFKQGVRTVDDAGLVQVDGSYYAALPAALHSEVGVRVFDQAIRYSRCWWPGAAPPRQIASQGRVRDQKY